MFEAIHWGRGSDARSYGLTHFSRANSLKPVPSHLFESLLQHGLRRFLRRGRGRDRARRRVRERNKGLTSEITINPQYFGYLGILQFLGKLSLDGVLCDCIHSNL